MGEQQSFLGRHGFVIAGVALPVLVVVAFAIARTLPRLLVKRPSYDLVYSAVADYSNTPRNVNCEIGAFAGKVRVRWTKSEQPVYAPTLRVYRFDASTGNAAEIAVPDPGDLDANGGVREFFLEGFEGTRIDTSPKAPDGYEYDFSYGSSSGLFGEIFSHGSRGARSTIKKDGRVIALPRTNPQTYGYESVTFIGWVIPSEAAR